MEYKLRLRARWFKAIKEGTKTVEGRLYRNQCVEMEPGDVIQFICERLPGQTEPEIIKCIITGLTVADSFRDLYNKYGEQLLPSYCLNGDEITDPPIVYDTINDYKDAVQRGTKVLGIKLSIVAE